MPTSGPAGSYRKPVNRFQVETEQCGHFPVSKLDVRTKMDVRVEERPYLRLNAHQYEFGVKRHSTAYAHLKPARLPLDVPFYVAHLARNYGRRLHVRGSRGGGFLA